MPDLRLAFITDIHHGADYGTKLGAQALPLLDRFRTWCAGHSPDLVVELGDRINNVAPDVDARLTREVAQAFRGFRSEVVHLLGNHDCHGLSIEEAEAALQYRFQSHSRDRNGLHLVFWNADVHKDPFLGYSAHAADLEWLERDLAATDLPTIVCSHVPLDGGSMAGNLYFEKGLSAGNGGYVNSEAARAVIEASGKVILCIAGHTHWNALAFVDGVPYVTIPSLTEAFMTWPDAASAWASCVIGDDIRIRVEGGAPLEYRLPTRPLGRHWVNKYKSYAPKPPDRVPPKGH